MKGLYKIGQTSRTPDERSVELFTTGVPTPFEIEVSIKVDFPEKCEKEIFTKLARYRVSKSREFFQNISLANLLREIFPVLGNYKIEYWKDNLDVYEIQNEIKVREDQIEQWTKKDIRADKNVKKWISQNYNILCQPLIKKYLEMDEFGKQIRLSAPKRFGDVFRKRKLHDEIFRDFFKLNKKLIKNHALELYELIRNAKKFHYGLWTIVEYEYDHYGMTYSSEIEAYLGHPSYRIQNRELPIDYRSLNLHFKSIKKITLFENDFADSISGCSGLNIFDAFELMKNEKIFNDISNKFDPKSSAEYIHKIDIYPLFHN